MVLSIISFVRNFEPFIQFFATVSGKDVFFKNNEIILKRFTNYKLVALIQ